MYIIETSITQMHVTGHEELRYILIVISTSWMNDSSQYRVTSVARLDIEHNNIAMPVSKELNDVYFSIAHYTEGCKTKQSNMY